MPEKTNKPRKKPGPKKGEGGRPRILIDWKEFDKLCALHCTLRELAEWFECDQATIERAVKREKHTTFAEYFKNKAGRGNISLRRAQWINAVEKGNVTMQIWLGKQWLGQTDHPEWDADGQRENHIVVDLLDL